VSWSPAAHTPVTGMSTAVAGRLGTEVPALLWNIVEVRSPMMDRRQADRPSTPKRSATSLGWEVWPKVNLGSIYGTVVRRHSPQTPPIDVTEGAAGTPQVALASTGSGRDSVRRKAAKSLGSLIP
jgi:hypothetical protein